MTQTDGTRLERVASIALRLARRCAVPYSSYKSRKDFTQPQLIACLVLKAASKTDYRGVCELLELSPRLRQRIGLEKVPHWTTLQKFSAREGTRETLGAVIEQVLLEVGVGDGPAEVAVDSTGLQGGVASEHYQTRRGLSGKARRYVKLSVAVLGTSLLPAALVVDMGPTVDMAQMPSLLDQVERRVGTERLSGGTLWADRGYDAEWVHERCREQWSCRSLIPPVPKGPNGVVKSKYRSELVDPPREYGRRWFVESYFSGLKRTTLSTLSARSVEAMLTEATLKVLAYAVRR
jgi:hypothetical protein